MGRRPQKKAPQNPCPRKRIAGRTTPHTSTDDGNFTIVQEDKDGATMAPVFLNTETERADGGIASEVRRVSSEQIKQAQNIILRSVKAGEVAQMMAIDIAIATLYPHKTKPGQREALQHLIYLRKDLILIAGTGFGKSMILQAVSVLLQKAVTIVILPLDQIGNEQSEYIRQIGGIPCFLNRDTINPKLLKGVQQRRFTHILISPELAISDNFRPVASNPSFKQFVSLVVVDEAHLVYHWGRAFRTAYSRLNLLRSWLGSQIPWFACSATLDPQTLESLRKGISFEADVKIQRTPIDRPELLFRIGWIPKRAGFKALHFLLTAEEKNVESVYQQLGKIPKTIIFFDSRKDAHTAAEECRNWLLEIRPQHFTPRQVMQALRVFHRNTPSTDKKAILSEFVKGETQSRIRVVFATEALGMGVDIPDVRRTVQWGIPTGEHASTQLQRGGRASRDKLDGEMIMLLPGWASGERSPGLKQIRKQNKRQRSVTDANSTGLEAGQEVQKQKKLTDKQRRDNLSDFWYDLANSEQNDPSMCLRRQFLDFFNEPNEYRSGRRSYRCCSNCNPQTRLGKLDGFYQYQECGPRANNRTKAVSVALDKWVEEQACLLYQGCALVPESTFFLSSDLREKLAKNAHSVLCIESLRKLLGPWRWSHSHEQGLFNIIWHSYRPVSAVTPNSQPSQSQPPGLSSQSTLTVSPSDLSTPASVPTPTQESRRSWEVALSPISTPLALNMPMQSQNPWPEPLKRETNSRPLLVRQAASKRPALEPISGNERAKKVRIRDIKRSTV